MNWTRAILIAMAILLVAQLVPYGRVTPNPPVSSEPEWDTPQTRSLFFEACRDCHSNETEWPWYSHVAPASWLVRRDVDEGRSHFNVSEWNRPSSQHGDEAAEKVEEGDMPPWFYLPLHAHARLSQDQTEQLVKGLVATFGREEDETPHEHGIHEH